MIRNGDADKYKEKGKTSRILVRKYAQTVLQSRRNVEESFKKTRNLEDVK